MSDHPLQSSIEDGQLVIRIGIDRLAFCTEFIDVFKPYDYEAVDWVLKYRICDKEEFAKDVLRAMNREAEDGSTPFTRFLDKMCVDALEDGSLGIEDVQDKR